MICSTVSSLGLSMTTPIAGYELTDSCTDYDLTDDGPPADPTPARQRADARQFGDRHGLAVLAHRHLLDMNRGAAERIQDQLAAALGRPLKVRIEIGDIASETPAQRDAIERRARHAEAVAALEADPFVRELIERFDATLVESTVKPL